MKNGTKILLIVLLSVYSCVESMEKFPIIRSASLAGIDIDAKKMIVDAAARLTKAPDALSTVTALSQANKAYRLLTDDHNLKIFIIDRAVEYIRKKRPFAQAHGIAGALNQLSQKNPYIRSMAQDVALSSYIMDNLINLCFRKYVLLNEPLPVDTPRITRDLGLEMGELSLGWFRDQLSQNTPIKQEAEGRLSVIAQRFSITVPYEAKRWLSHFSILLRGGGNPNVRQEWEYNDYPGQYSMLFAAFVNFFQRPDGADNYKLFEMLLNAGADINAPVVEGYSATILDYYLEDDYLDYCCSQIKKSKPKLLKYLRSKGAKRSSELMQRIQ